jgi:hypothetical protein
MRLHDIGSIFVAGNAFAGAFVGAKTALTRRRKILSG